MLEACRYSIILGALSRTSLSLLSCNSWHVGQQVLVALLTCAAALPTHKVCQGLLCTAVQMKVRSNSTILLHDPSPAMPLWSNNNKRPFTPKSMSLWSTSY